MVTISAAAMLNATKTILGTEDDPEGHMMGIAKMLGKIEKEQPEIMVNLYLIGVKSPQMLKGFILAYLTIQNQLEVDELAKLEKLGRL